MAQAEAAAVLMVVMEIPSTSYKQIHAQNYKYCIWFVVDTKTDACGRGGVIFVISKSEAPKFKGISGD